MKLAVNHKIVEASVAADMTVLAFLREQGLTGTKEGCASGDCGACTVIVRRRTDTGVKSETVNACIAPVGQFAGCHLVTVEGLAGEDGLHPAQEEMVRHHGSQCGFCTPGFVMSIAALVENGVPADREAVLQGISGNLCRCTGYRPIVEAGVAALNASPTIDDTALLNELHGGEMGAVIQPLDEPSLQQAIRENPGARLIAGGTDLFLEVTQQFTSIPLLIDLCRVDSLCEVEIDDGSIIVGAAVPYTRLEPLLGEHSKPLAQLLLRLGSRQIRNRGTVGGNLANGSPIADMPPILIAWDAALELISASGETRRVPVADFYRGYRDTVLAADEYIARIHIPRASTGMFHRFYKSSKRLEDDISSVMGAFAFDGSGSRMGTARVAFGGMAATPVRLGEVEALLTSRDVDERLIVEAAAMLETAMTPLTDVRASADYRMAMAQSMLERALHAWLGNELPLVTEVAIEGQPGA